MVKDIEVRSVETNGVLWQARNAGQSIRLITPDMERKKIIAQLIVDGAILASTNFKFRLVRDRDACVERARTTGHLTFVQGTCRIAAR